MEDYYYFYSLINNTVESGGQKFIKTTFANLLRSSIVSFHSWYGKTAVLSGRNKPLRQCDRPIVEATCYNPFNRANKNTFTDGYNTAHIGLTVQIQITVRKSTIIHSPFSSYANFFWPLHVFIMRGLFKEWDQNSASRARDISSSAMFFFLSRLPIHWISQRTAGIDAYVYYIHNGFTRTRRRE